MMSSQPKPWRSKGVCSKIEGVAKKNKREGEPRDMKSE
jgi:hypothetical protein